MDDYIKSLCDEHAKYNTIDESSFEKFSVKRGMRNEDGTGVLAGLTNICTVHGYIIDENEKRPDEGRLIYRGIDINDIVANSLKEDRLCFEESIFLLLIGRLPNSSELERFKKELSSRYDLPLHFTRDVIMSSPSPNIMNKLAQCVLALYSYDDNPESNEIEDLMRQSLDIIAKMPAMIVSAFESKRRTYDKESIHIHYPNHDLSLAENFLYMLRKDNAFTKEEAHLLDICMLLHADHSGGNNSTFATRVLSSAGTDTYSTIAAAISSLKGYRHGGANVKVTMMLDDIKKNCEDFRDPKKLSEYLEKIIRKQAGDGTGLIYGMGHAVYTISDPRTIIVKQYSRKLAEQKGMLDDYNLLENIEKLTPEIFRKVKGDVKTISANVDMYSGFIYRLLGIADEMHTAIFSMARVAGWCAHRIEEIQTGKRIIRPAYKSVNPGQKYVSLKDR